MMRAYTLPETTTIEKRLAKKLSGTSASPVVWKTFPDGELFCRLREVAEDACVIGRTKPPADFFRTALLIDTLHRAGAKRVTAAIPYFAYSRQDRQIESGDAVTAHFVMRALAAAGASRIVTVDLHSENASAASAIPVVSVNVAPSMALALRVALGRSAFTVVAPDHGAKTRADRLGSELEAREPAWLEKKRDPRTGKVKLLAVHGDLNGDTAVIVDDIIDTGSTIALAVATLREKGFSSIHLCVTHPVFSPGAAEAIRKLRLVSVITTNTIEITPQVARIPGLKVIDVSERLADAVRNGTAA